MPKRKLEDLLKLKDNAPAHPAKQATNPPKDVLNPQQAPQTNEKGQVEVPLDKSKRTKSSRAATVDVSKELASLKYSKKNNKHLPRLPRHVTIEKRPINHGPIASPFAGPDVPKVIYVSRRTPVISAVKRVKQFLREIEKRAMQSAGVSGVLDRAASSKGGDKELQRKLGEVSEKLGRDAEEVLVKASGRALEQALRIAEWFRKREEEMLCKVEVRTGKVSVIDDIVETKQAGGTIEDEDGGEDEDDQGVAIEEKEDEMNTTFEVGDTTMELLENLDKHGGKSTTQASREPAAGPEGQDNGTQPTPPPKRKRRRRKEYEPDDIPEARLRWVKTVEVAISLRA